MNRVSSWKVLRTLAQVLGTIVFESSSGNNVANIVRRCTTISANGTRISANGCSLIIENAIAMNLIPSCTMAFVPSQGIFWVWWCHFSHKKQFATNDRVTNPTGKKVYSKMIRKIGKSLWYCELSDAVMRTLWCCPLDSPVSFERGDIDVRPSHRKRYLFLEIFRPPI